MASKNIHSKLLGLSISSAVLLTLGWPMFGFFPLLWIGFVPIFFAHYLIHTNNLGSLWVFVYGFIAFLGFNLGTTWWVYNASAAGGILAFVLNALLMTLPLMVLHKFAIKHNNPIRIWPFIWAWLAFEYLHFRWDGTWTWLTLGNGFASVPKIVQWYEYTGVAGGSLWILWVNKSIYQLALRYQNLDKNSRLKKIFNLAFFKLFAPIFFSFYVLSGWKDFKENQSFRYNANVLVVQPNIDPYKEKFDGLTAEQQTQIMLNIADKNMDSSVQLVVFPETALVGNLNERSLNEEETINLIRAFMHKYPQVNILTGADSYKTYLPTEKPSETARSWDNGVHYDVFNSAFFLSQNDSTIRTYHKSKLVPGVERLPFSSILKFVEKFAVDLGGTSGSLGIDKEPVVFNESPKLNIAPIICYESIFGDYVTEYIKRGATLLCIITNDGWWGNTPGYKQHMEYARLRAIETRRYVARSANTGISGFIDDEGNITNKTDWWVATSAKQKVFLNTNKTFYVEYGSIIGEIALLLALYFIIGLFYANKLIIKS